MNERKAKPDAYIGIEQLQTNLRKLFLALEYNPEEIIIRNPARLRYVLENIVNSGLIVDYLSKLNKQISQAAKLAEDKRIDGWSEAETANEAELEGLRQRASDIENGIKRLEERAGKAEDRLEKQEKMLEESKKTHIEMIMNVISMRDSLLMKKGLLEQGGKNKSGSAERVVEMLLRESANILTKAGVEILEDSGEFDSKRQTIVDTRKTQDEKLVNHIAEVFRPGYLLDGEQLRGQEVIIYVADC